MNKMTIKRYIIFCLFYILCFNISFAQIISEKFNNQPLREVLEFISNKYGVKLAYDNALVNDVSISATINALPVDKALIIILKETELEAMMLNQVWIIKKRQLSASENKAKTKTKRTIGVIRDKNTGETLPYVTVNFEKDYQSLQTNADGYMVLPSDFKDTVILKVNYLGFEPIEMKISTLNLEHDRLIVELNPIAKNLHENFYHKDNFSIIEIGQKPGELILNTRDIQILPQITHLDAISPLSFTPGIDATFESLSGLIVRHAASDKTLITYDGFKIYHIDHLFGAISSINSSAIKDIRIYRGGSDASSGGYSSALVEITGKTGNENKFSAEAGFDRLSSNITFEGPINKKLTFIVAARKSFTEYYRSDLYLNLIQSLNSDFNFNRKNISFFTFASDSIAPKIKYYDINAKLSYKISDFDKLSLSTFIAHDKLNFNQHENYRSVYEYSDWSNRGIGIRWARQWNDIVYHQFSMGYSTYSMGYDHKTNIVRTRLRDTIIRNYITSNKLYDFNLNLLFRVKPTNNHAIESGAQFNTNEIYTNEQYLHTFNTNIISDTGRNYHFIPANIDSWLQYTFSKYFVKSLTLGVRSSYYVGLQKMYYDPRLQLVIALTPLIQIKSSYGIYRQFVNKIFQVGSSYKNLWVAADKNNFPVVETNSYSLGLTYKTKNSLHFDIEGYYKNTTGLTILQNLIQQVGNNQIKQNYKIYTLNHTAYGIDILMRKKSKFYETWLSYTLSKSINQSASMNKGDQFSAIDDHLHELKIGSVFSYNRWILSLTWIYGSPRPWDELIFTSNMQLSPNYKKNSARLSPYHRLDASLTKSWNIGKSKLDTGIKGFNLYNKTNILSKTYTLTDTPIIDWLQKKSFITYNEHLGIGFSFSFFVCLKI